MAFIPLSGDQTTKKGMNNRRERGNAEKRVL